MGFLAIGLLAALGGMVYPYIKGMRRRHFGFAALALFIAIIVIAPPPENSKSPKTDASSTSRTVADSDNRKAPDSPKQTALAQAIEQMKREIVSVKKNDVSSLATHDDIMIQMVVIGARAKILADNPGPYTAAQQITVATFKRACSDWQARIFPKMRAAQAKIYDTALWEQKH